MISVSRRFRCAATSQTNALSISIARRILSYVSSSPLGRLSRALRTSLRVTHRSSVSIEHCTHRNLRTRTYMPSAFSHKTERISVLNPVSRSLSRWRASSSRVTCSSISADNLSAMSSMDTNGSSESTSTIVCKGRLETKSRT
ncbi:hypothetical protein L210DRAFT_3564664 [Boletus edulis BED1]|uniref:Uncharacterized protein n=1 Tax=Boletus edulis BED1 TaxID=1328754 RepID=A0AAD4BFP3_BOLED|nr:hypothetical protein L210DRAFT_3564664 [Boletus edulis BED1]